MSELNSIEKDTLYEQVKIYLMEKYKSDCFSNLPNYKNYKDTLQNYYNNLARENAQQTLKSVQSLSKELYIQQIVEKRAVFSKIFKVCCLVTMLSYGVNTVAKYFDGEHRFSYILDKIKFGSSTGMVGGVAGTLLSGCMWLFVGAQF